MNFEITGKYRLLAYVIIALLPILIYSNAIDNEYGIDDYYVTEGNPKVAGGLSAIPDLFQNYYVDNGVTRYEYRPLTHTTFAIEKALFKELPLSQTIEEKEIDNQVTQANISHLINVLLYAFNGVLLLWFLFGLLKDYPPILPVLIVVLFLIHPIHTEVVNNIKSRDELLMMVFFLLSLGSFIRYARGGKTTALVLAGCFIFLAFLSKMSALAVFGLVPVLGYFIKAPTKRILMGVGVAVLALAVILLLRENLPGEQYREFRFFENPLFVEDGLFKRLALGFYTTFFYLQLLVYPEHLSFYYGYNQIPQATFSYWQVWVSMLVFLPLGIYGIVRFLKRDLLGLAIVLWLGVMAIVANVVYPMVGIVAERFGYIFSLGFAMVIAVLIWRAYLLAKAKLNPTAARVMFFLVLIAVGGLYSWRVIDRNSDWENRLVLFRNDIKHLDQSFRAHTFLADELFTALPQLVSRPNGTDFIREIEQLYTRAIEIDPRQPNTLNNLGALQYKFYKDYQKSIQYFEQAKRYDNQNTDIFLNAGYAYAELNQYQKAVASIERALILNPTLSPGYTYLLSLIKKPEAHPWLQKAFSSMPKANPKIAQQKQYWTTVAQFYGKTNQGVVAVDSFAKAFLLDPNDQALGKEVIRMYTELGDLQKAAYFKGVLDQ